MLWDRASATRRKLAGLDLPSEATQILQTISQGADSDTDRLMEIVYDDFRKLAKGYIQSGPPGGTLQPTALVHEAFLRLVDQNDVDWSGRSHFFSVGAIAMRQILVDQARRNSAEKRGGNRHRIVLDETIAVSPRSDEDVIVIDDALVKLARLSVRSARIVEMRFFAGMGMQEVAEALGVSRSTVQKEWAAASVWLRREISIAVS